jgi:SSS family solute:Na+ symporter
MLSSVDLTIIAIYALVLLFAALYVSTRKSANEVSSEDYFLAGKSLPWWAIGASLIAANISAEQIIGQSGQGFVVGLAIAAYEWQAAIVLIIVAKYFLPIFLEKKIYTMPQFLELRFGRQIKSLMAVFWVILYTAVNLTAVLWLGGLALTALTGWNVVTAMMGLAIFAVIYSLYGGLKAVALTDIIQVVVLIAGGFVITGIVLSLVGNGAGIFAGLGVLMDQIPGHFEMILADDHPSYSNLPGIWTLLGGLWVLHFSYWGFNQYIIQRALGAESLEEAQKGLAFAAALKLLIPIIVVIPGIAALYLAQQGQLDMVELSSSPDSTYGILMNLVPEGLRGLVFAALIAAIVSSLASMMNSISTIFTMDIYRDMVAPGRSEGHYVTVGRMTSVTAMIIAVILAKPFLGGMESAFQTIQEYTGFIAPGIVSVFLLGMFWSRCNATGAFAMLFVSVVANILLKFFTPDLAFVIRIWIVFLSCLVVGFMASRFADAPSDDQIINLDDMKFATSISFNRSAVAITVLLVAIYLSFW